MPQAISFVVPFPFTSFFEDTNLSLFSEACFSSVTKSFLAHCLVCKVVDMLPLLKTNHSPWHVDLTLTFNPYAPLNQKALTL